MKPPPPATKMRSFFSPELVIYKKFCVGNKIHVREGQTNTHRTNEMSLNQSASGLRSLNGQLKISASLTRDELKGATEHLNFLSVRALCVFGFVFCCATRLGGGGVDFANRSRAGRPRATDLRDERVLRRRNARVRLAGHDVRVVAQLGVARH